MSENFGSEYKEYFGGEIHDNYNSEGKMSEPSFLFFTFSWNNIPSTSLPNTKKQDIDAIRNEIGLIEGLFLTVFGLLAMAFFVAQVILYVKFCTSRRNSWSVRRRGWRIHTLSFTCPRYEGAKGNRRMDGFTVTAVPCKPGLAYSARSIRSGDLVYISPIDEGAGTRWHSGSFRMAQSNYASVFMVDSRGHFGPRLQASPEATLQICSTKERSNTVRMAQREKCCCHRRTCSLPPPISPAGAKECENPGYESDTVSSSRVSPDIVSTTASFQKVMLAGSPTTCSDREGDSESPVHSDGHDFQRPNFITSMLNSNELEKCTGFVSDSENDCNRKRRRTFLYGRYSSYNENIRRSTLFRDLKYNRSVICSSSSDSDRNSPDSSAKCLKASKRATLTSGSESDFSLTSVSSLSVLSAIPMPSLFSKSKSNANQDRAASRNSLKNSWLAKV